MEYEIRDIVRYSRGAQFLTCRYIYQKKLMEKIIMAWITTKLTIRKLKATIFQTFISI